MLDKTLTELFQKALQTIEGADPALVEITPATQLKFGDFQTNVAMQHARLLKKKPRDIAEEIVAALPENEIILSTEIMGPGFINIRLQEKSLGRALLDQYQNEFLGVEQSGAGKTVIVDYSSPNVAKTMHVAHLRSTIIGDALKRIFLARGFRVLGDNHIGDWGTQFGKLLVAYNRFERPEELAKDSVELLEYLYQEFNRRTEEDPSLEDEARSELARLQKKEEPNFSLWQKFISISLAEFEKVYSRLGVEFELVRGESFYNDMLHETVDHLKATEIVRESEGAMVAFFEEDKFPPCLVQKRDGAFLYASTDIATVRSRVEEFQPERIVYVTDSRQKLHFQQFFDITRRAGFTARLEHVMFGLMRFGEGMVMSSRKGAVIPLAELLDQAEQKALDVVADQEYSEEDKKEIARVVGVGAVKYQDLSQNPASDIVFTWDKALNLQGNSAPYLQYAYARVQGLSRRYTEQFGELPQRGEIAIESDTVRGLVLLLMEYSNIVLRASETCKPNGIADWLFQLSQSYSSFYNQHPILREEAEELRQSRMLLSLITARHLKHGLNLLGIEVLERM